MLLPAAERASGSQAGDRLRHHPIRAVGELVDPPQLLRSSGERGECTSSRSSVAASARSVPAIVILK